MPEPPDWSHRHRHIKENNKIENNYKLSEQFQQLLHIMLSRELPLNTKLRPAAIQSFLWQHLLLILSLYLMTLGVVLCIKSCLGSSVISSPRFCQRVFWKRQRRTHRQQGRLYLPRGWRGRHRVYFHHVWNEKRNGRHFHQKEKRGLF